MNEPSSPRHTGGGLQSPRVRCSPLKFAPRCSLGATSIQQPPRPEHCNNHPSCWISLARQTQASGQAPGVLPREWFDAIDYVRRFIHPCASPPSRTPLVLRRKADVLESDFEAVLVMGAASELSPAPRARVRPTPQRRPRPSTALSTDSHSPLLILPAKLVPLPLRSAQPPPPSPLPRHLPSTTRRAPRPPPTTAPAARSPPSAAPSAWKSASRCWSASPRPNPRHPLRRPPPPAAGGPLGAPRGGPRRRPRGPPAEATRPPGPRTAARATSSGPFNS